MDIELPDKITKKIANQARMTVASAINYARSDENVEQKATIACYNSVIRELLYPLSTPWNSNRPPSPDRESELFDFLQQRYGYDDVYYDAVSKYDSKTIHIKLGQGVVVNVGWSRYNYYFKFKFSTSDVYSLDFTYDDFMKALPMLDFVRDNIHTWQPLAEECIRDYRKKQKVREIKATAVKSFATLKLDECGIPYRLEQGKVRDKIYFKISAKDMAMFYLSHKDFDTAIDR